MRCALLLALGILASSGTATASPPNGAPLLRSLGRRAQVALEPRASTIGAVVRVPPSIDLAAVGLVPFSPGFARLRGTSDELLAFADAHPELPLEVAFPPHLLLDQVGLWTHAVAARQEYGVDGTGVLIGLADTGVDFTLEDFLDPTTGHSRIAWFLDLSCSPGMLGDPCVGDDGYPQLSNQFGKGGVFQGSDLDKLLGEGDISSEADNPLTDDVGHGTHTASIAAGNGGVAGKYVGIAPGAGLIVARITRDASQNIATDDLLTGVQFLFDRADFMKRPIAVNLSIGSDFGSHDGTMAWEQALAGYVGPSYPGHALVVAAGNSGDITAEQVHATAYVPDDGTTRSVPIFATQGGSVGGGGQIQVWVTMRSGASLSVGLDGPDGTWIAPVGSNQTGSYTVGIGDGGDAARPMLQASVDNGSSVSGGQIPSDSTSAIVLWQGDFAAGRYAITLTGHGVADLYVEGSGDALNEAATSVGFVDPVREGTITIPATHPDIIGVGCTVNRASWISQAGAFVTVDVSPLDPRGGYAIDGGTYLTPVSGDVCWFSSAGPTVTGVPKPEISAPGGLVIAAMSGWAAPTYAVGGYTNGESIFDNPGCPSVVDGGPTDTACMQVDPTHAVSAGTSMSSPQAAGAAALLFQKDPTLTQDKILGLLQAGAHPFRSGTPRFEDQGGPGELDIQGSLDALDQEQDPKLALPTLARSWITLSADEATADGSTPLTAVVELRTADGDHRADFFASDRLVALVELDGQTLSHLPPIARRAPGVWLFTVTPPPGLGGHTLTLGATFDGAAIVASKSVLIATDTWTANYPSSASGGGCAVARGNAPCGSGAPWLLAVWLAVRLRRRRRYSLASETDQPCGSRR